MVVSFAMLALLILMLMQHHMRFLAADWQSFVAGTTRRHNNLPAAVNANAGGWRMAGHTISLVTDELQLLLFPTRIVGRGGCSGVISWGAFVS
jgi:hypothetical protein